MYYSVILNAAQSELTTVRRKKSPDEGPKKTTESPTPRKKVPRKKVHGKKVSEKAFSVKNVPHAVNRDSIDCLEILTTCY